MADDPLNVQHKIRLEYEEQIKSSLLPHLAALQRQLGQITKSFQKHSKGIGGIGSATKGTTKINQAFGKSSARAAAQMSGMSKMAFGAGKALGRVGIAAIIATKTFGVMYKAIKKIADSQAIFAEFAAQTGKGSEAVFALKDAYVDLSKTTEGAAISVRGLTTAMADFARSGFPQQLMASSDAVMAAVGKLEDTLVRAVGAENARKMTSAVFHGALKDNVPVLNALIDSLQRAGSEGRSMEQDIGNIARQFAAFDEVNFRGIMGAMQTLQDQTQGTADGGVAAFTKWEQITGKLGALFTQLKQNLIDTFGADLARLLDTASKKMSEWVGDIGTWLETFRDWYVGAKVIVHNYVEVWKMAWYGIKGAGEIVFAELTAVAAKALSFITVGFSDTAKAMEKWAAKTRKSGDKAFDMAKNPNILIIEDQILLAQREREALTKKQTSSTQKTLGPLAALLAKQTEIRDQLTKTILPGVTSWTAALKNTASAMRSLGELTDLVGANYQVVGQNIGAFTREMGQAQLETARKLLDASSSEKLLATLKLIRNINQEIAMEGPSDARTQKRAEAMKQQSDILAGQVEAYKTLKMYIQGYTKDIDASLRLTEKSRQLSEAQLKVTQAVYGTPALAVAAQLAIVKTMEKEKNLLKERLAREQEAIANMSEADIAAGGLQFAQEALLKTQTELTNKTADQLNLVKQLRDGYLSAVKAQALGAGRFSKILITQEKNLMRGLDKRIAKTNTLLGQYGKAAGAADASAMRFSDSRLGLETMEGKEVTPEVARREQEARMAGAPERQASVGREANEIVMGIVSSADKNTLDVIESQTKQTKEYVGAIDRFASEQSQRAATAAGLQGRPGVTALGEAQRRAGAGLEAKEFNAGQYLARTKKLRASKASQTAMLNYEKGKPGAAPDKSGLGPKTGAEAEFDVSAANKFNTEALVYYQKFLDVFGGRGVVGGGGVRAGQQSAQPGGGGTGGLDPALVGAVAGTAAAVATSVVASAIKSPIKAVIGTVRVGMLGYRGVKETANLGARGARAAAPHVGRAAMVSAEAAKTAAMAGHAALVAETALATAAVGVAAGATAAASVYTLGKSVQTASVERVALGATEKAMEDDRLRWVAAENKKSDDEITRLVGKRQEIDSMLASKADSGAGAGLHTTFAKNPISWIYDQFTMGEDFDTSDTQKKQTEKLRVQRRGVQEQINALRKKKEIEEAAAELMVPQTPPPVQLAAPSPELMGPPVELMGPPAAPPVVPSGLKISPTTQNLSGGVGEVGANRGTLGKIGGNMQSKMKVVTQILMELARGVDLLKEDVNNTTEYAAGRGTTPNNQPAN